LRSSGLDPFLINKSRARGFDDMIFDSQSNSDIIRSLEGEAAKSRAELQCAENDIKQAQARIKFLLAAIHHLKQRSGDMK